MRARRWLCKWSRMQIVQQPHDSGEVMKTAKQRIVQAALAASGAFPPLLVRLAAVGERGGSLAGTLERAAAAHEGEVAGALAALVALVEPALILAMGGVVLILVAAILLPLFELNALVR